MEPIPKKKPRIDKFTLLLVVIVTAIIFMLPMGKKVLPSSVETIKIAAVSEDISPELLNEVIEHATLSENRPVLLDQVEYIEVYRRYMMLNEALDHLTRSHDEEQKALDILNELITGMEKAHPEILNHKENE